MNPYNCCRIVLFGLLALLLLPALQAAVQDDAEVARYIRIQHARAGEIAWLLGLSDQYGLVDAGGRQGGSLKEFLPVGIKQVLTFESQNALLVKANSPDAIDEFERLLRLVDQPVKMAYLDAMLVTVKAAEVKALGPYMTPPTGDDQPRMPARAFHNREALGKVLGNLVLNTGARVVSAQRVGIPNGEMGFMDFTGLRLSVRELLGIAILGVTVHPDGTVSLQYEAVGLKQTAKLRVRSGEVVLIPLQTEPEAAGEEDDNRMTTLMFLSATIAPEQFNLVSTLVPSK